MKIMNNTVVIIIIILVIAVEPLLLQHLSVFIQQFIAKHAPTEDKV